ncbi:hypothetical protein [Taibaiella soli]|uniref:Uncharacterized protein n=1 Tax=Taibaiella soli TaxID=1649169 RepID=A0A2W2AZE5_9BACT|nr:hypothetical protein [Taibaiella soli]PZF73394.1 hypothetical protein DN068_08360 [Taibaiella soli]
MSVLQVKYAELLSLSVTQLFYQNKVCKKYQAEPILDFQIVPTQETITLLRRLDWVYKPTDTNGGFVIMARVSGDNGSGNDLLRFIPKKGEKLTFGVTLRNYDVINFNDLPIQQTSDELYYFSNQISDNTAARSSLHLTHDTTGVNSNDIVKFSTSAYSFHSTSPIGAGTAVVKHLLTGATVFAKSLANQNGQADVAFDLSGFASGKCQLLISNVVADEFYYLGSSFIQPVFGVIEINLSDALDANFRVVESDGSITPDRPQYNILYTNRKTFWRYNIFLQPNSPIVQEMNQLSAADKTDFLSRLNVVTNDTNISFTAVTVNDSQLVFVSAQALPLQENYMSGTSSTPATLTMTLKKYIGNNAKEASVKTNLSFPPTETIDATNLPNIYSNIFLTI